MLKILINSYTCCPAMGSEPGMGWNWIVHLAKFCELFIITEGEYKNQIEEWTSMSNNSIEAGRMHFYYNPVTERIRRMCWNQGDWRFYIYYRKWQKKTADMARCICKTEKIDILHQLNMIGFREPGYLWKVSQETGIPFVWGPVDAKESFPMVYTQGTPLKTRLFLHTKNIITHWQLKHSRRVHQAVKTASCVLSASSNSVRTFKTYFNIDSPLMNETGTYPIYTHEASSKKQTFDILWVGKMDFRKQLGITLKSISMLCQPDIRLHIVGNGDDVSFIVEAEKLGIANLCVVYGNVSHEQVIELMKSMDLLFFTSIAEGTPHVVLEAISCQLPVLCFDTCGQGDCVNETVGFKIPLTNPEQSVKDFAEKIEYLYHHREELTRMSANCQKRAEELTWENKARQMVELYERMRE